MRSAFLSHLLQTRIADLHRQAQRDAPVHALAAAATPEVETRHATRFGSWHDRRRRSRGIAGTELDAIEPGLSPGSSGRRRSGR
jgi:hypothetical protein